MSGRHMPLAARAGVNHNRFLCKVCGGANSCRRRNAPEGRAAARRSAGSTTIRRRGGRRADAGRAPAAPATPRGGSGRGGPAAPVAALISPVSSTRPCCSTSRRKFCLCSRTPASASTVRCSCSKVKPGGISSNTTGRYLILPRSRPIAVARIRRWSSAIAAPVAVRPAAPPAGPDRAAPPRRARPGTRVRSVRGPAPRSRPRRTTRKLAPAAPRAAALRSPAAAPAQRASAASIAPSRAGLPWRQSSHGKNRYQLCHSASAEPAGRASRTRAR